MADKYIVSGCSFCGKGDGPLIPTEAAHNDATGYAWGLTSTDTDAINIFSGSAPKYGTAVAAGDTVYIRSKTAAGADITVDLTSAVLLGVAAATITNRVTWVIDNGVTWSGQDGAIVFQSSADAEQVILRSGNDFIALTVGALEFRKTGTGVGNIICIYANNYIRGIKTSTPNATSGTPNHLYPSGSNSNGLLTAVDCVHEGRASYFIAAQGGNKVTLINPTIVSTTGGAIFSAGASVIKVAGGSLSGAGATTGAFVITKWGDAYGRIDLVGFTYPKTVKLAASRPAIDWPMFVSAVGVDGVLGGESVETWGEINSRPDNNAPTLTAVLPDSDSTPWSWFIYPNVASKSDPSFLQISKYYTEAAATKTVKLYFLIADSFTGADTSTVWATISYTDATTGVSKSITTKAIVGAALTTSSAGWSSLSYGPVTMLPREISFTTPTTIKQDTLISVVFQSSLASASANDIMIVCPDVQLS